MTLFGKARPYCFYLLDGRFYIVHCDDNDDAIRTARYSSDRTIVRCEDAGGHVLWRNPAA